MSERDRKRPGMLLGEGFVPWFLGGNLSTFLGYTNERRRLGRGYSSMEEGLLYIRRPWILSAAQQ